MRSRTSVALLAMAAGALILPACALAHPGDKGFATISLHGKSVRYQLLLPMTSFHPPAGDQARAGNEAANDYRRVADAVAERVLISVDGQACSRGTVALTPPADPSGSIAVVTAFTCHTDAPRQLNIRDELVEALSPEYVTIANVQWPGGSRQHVFKSDARTLRIELESASAAHGVASFFMLGVEHILLGWDHLLFVLALLLLGGTFVAVLKLITAFTVAHSLTLAAAVLDLVAVPARLVESLIALSIAYVAGERWLRADRAGNGRRWLVAFGFGLVHGLGFSGALREAGLPEAGLLWALFGFNLGVEAGQAAVVAIILPAIWRLRQTPRWLLIARAVAIALVLVGLSLFALRLLA